MEESTSRRWGERERERPKETKTTKTLGQMIDMRGRGRGGWAEVCQCARYLTRRQPYRKMPLIRKPE